MLGELSEGNGQVELIDAHAQVVFLALKLYKNIILTHTGGKQVAAKHIRKEYVRNTYVYFVQVMDDVNFHLRVAFAQPLTNNVLPIHLRS